MTPAEAKTFVQEIKSNYPAPKSSLGIVEHPQEGDYCVGGAYCYHLMKTHRTTELTGNFPDPWDIARNLRAVNSGLSDGDAFDMAEALTDFNDENNFAMAWNTLEEALCHPEGGRLADT